MEFYKSCFGGELAATKVKDSPAKDFMPAFQQDKIVNARLRNGKLEISTSDWLRPAQTPIRGQHGLSLSKWRNPRGIEDSI
jgi:uncharacterized glyoxalase superfamily protein PhnB